MDKDEKELIKEIHESIIEVKTVLLGIPGSANGGLCKKVEKVSDDVDILKKEHYILTRNFWLLVGTLAGSGVLGTSLWQLL